MRRGRRPHGGEVRGERAAVRRAERCATASWTWTAPAPGAGAPARRRPADGVTGPPESIRSAAHPDTGATASPPTRATSRRAVPGTGARGLISADRRAGLMSSPVILPRRGAGSGSARVDTLGRQVQRVATSGAHPTHRRRAMPRRARSCSGCATRSSRPSRPPACCLEDVVVSRAGRRSVVRVVVDLAGRPRWGGRRRARRRLARGLRRAGRGRPGAPAATCSRSPRPARPGR